MTYVALLRAINVGGRKMAMADLRDLASSLDFADVATLLQSGNLVFSTRRQSGAALERRLEAATEARFGLRTEYFVRTSAEWDGIVGANPFEREARDDPSHLVAILLKKPADAGGERALRAAIRGPEYVHVAGAVAYAVYPAGIGESKLTPAVIERALGCRVSARNWNTVRKLQALMAAGAD